jgi:16S rRNA (cytidine1402-2'-O)-methyltransferase
MGPAVSAERGELHLIPVTLGASDPRLVLPASAIQAACSLDYFIAENAKSARQFLKSVGHVRPLRELQIECFDKDGSTERATALLQPLLSGRSAGIVSEAGSPAIADPGALLVAAAHAHNIRVIPHVGPSAILLALMASGFNGQRFAFHGYLPVAKDDCRKTIATRERESREQDMTQVFIETPYRNDQLLQAFCEVCAGNSRLCVASDLTLSSESIRSSTIANWAADKAVIGRRPSVFLLYAR